MTKAGGQSALGRMARSLTIGATTLFVIAALTSAPFARANATDRLQDAVAQARAGSGCAPLRLDPIAEQVAAIVNKSYTDWLAHISTAPPISDPLPGLKELGYQGGKGIFLGGVSKKQESDAVKGVLLEGYAAIPDCGYTDFGADMFYDEASGYTMAAVVLAGP